MIAGSKAISPLWSTANGAVGRQAGILPKEAFTYEPAPTASSARPATIDAKTASIPGVNSGSTRPPPKSCSRCALQPQCTRSKSGRSLKRHVRQAELDRMRSQAESAQARRDRRQRQHLMERSFARSTRHGIKQARWRRQWRVAIQEFLTATIQNMLVLVRYLKEPLRAAAKALRSRAADMAGGHHVNGRGIAGANAIASLIRPIVAPSWASFSRQLAAYQFWLTTRFGQQPID